MRIELREKPTNVSVRGMIKRWFVSISGMMIVTISLVTAPILGGFMSKEVSFGFVIWGIIWGGIISYWGITNKYPWSK